MKPIHRSSAPQPPHRSQTRLLLVGLVLLLLAGLALALWRSAPAGTPAQATPLAALPHPPVTGATVSATIQPTGEPSPAGSFIPDSTATASSSSSSQDTAALIADLSTQLHAAADAAACRRLATQLARIGTEDAVEALWKEALARQEASQRTAILESLDTIATPEAVTFSASVLKATEDTELLEAAGRLLFRGAGPDAVNFLAQLHSETDSTPDQQSNIEWAVQGIRNESAIPALGALSRSPVSARLALCAAMSLSRMGNATARAELQQTLQALTAQGGAAAPLAAEVRELLSSSSQQLAGTY